MGLTDILKPIDPDQSKKPGIRSPLPTYQEPRKYSPRAIIDRVHAAYINAKREFNLLWKSGADWYEDY